MIRHIFWLLGLGCFLMSSSAYAEDAKPTVTNAVIIQQGTLGLEGQNFSADCKTFVKGNGDAPDTELKILVNAPEYLETELPDPAAAKNAFVYVVCPNGKTDPIGLPITWATASDASNKLASDATSTAPTDQSSTSNLGSGMSAATPSGGGSYTSSNSGGSAMGLGGGAPAPAVGTPPPTPTPVELVPAAVSAAATSAAIVLSPAPTRAPDVTAWLGDTYGGANNKWVQNAFDSIFVASDGTVFTASTYDEGGNTNGFYGPGGTVGNLGGPLGQKGYGETPGPYPAVPAISGDANYVFTSVVENNSNGITNCDGPLTDANNDFYTAGGVLVHPPCDTITWYSIKRFDHAGNTASFTTGVGNAAYTGNGYYGAALVVYTTQIISSSTDSNNTTTTVLQSNGVTYTTVVTNSGATTTTVSPANAKTSYNAVISGVQGIAVGGGYVYVSDPSSNKIDVFHETDLSPVHSFSFLDGSGNSLVPGTMVYDAYNNSLWIAVLGTGTVLHYSVNGGLLSQSIVSPTGQFNGLSIDTVTNPNLPRLIVTDNGPDQNVKVYGSIETSPTLVDTWGVQGGPFGPHGSPTGFAHTESLANQQFNNPVGAGVDAQGNRYVATSGIWGSVVGNTIGYSGADRHILEFDVNGNPIQNIYATEYTTDAVFDPTTDGHDIYTPDFHYAVNPTGTGNIGTLVSDTVNPAASPTDPRNAFYNPGLAMKIIYLGGKKFLYELVGNNIMVYRFVGETAVPWTSLNVGFDYNGTANNAKYWVDTNRNGNIDANEYVTSTFLIDAGDYGGWYIDDLGTIWATIWTPEPDRPGAPTSKIVAFHPQLDSSTGNPIYSDANVSIYPFPAMFTGTIASTGGSYLATIQRLFYNPVTDTMYLSGYANTSANGTYPCGAASIGDTLVRIDAFTSSNPKIKWQSSLPYICPSTGIGVGATPHSIDIAGNAIFTVDSGSLSAPDQNGNYNITGGGIDRVYDTETGNLTASFYPDSTVTGPIVDLGWTDVVYAIHAFERRDGSYLVLTEEDERAKTIAFIWH